MVECDGATRSPSHGAGCGRRGWVCRPWHNQSVPFQGCRTLLLRLAPLFLIHTQSHLKEGRCDRDSDAPDGAGDVHTATHLGKTWSLWPAPSRARAPAPRVECGFLGIIVPAAKPQPGFRVGARDGVHLEQCTSRDRLAWQYPRWSINNPHACAVLGSLCMLANHNSSCLDKTLTRLASPPTWAHTRAYSGACILHHV